MNELSPDTRAWIDAAAVDDAPRPEDRARIRQRLALELGAAAIAASTLVVGAPAAAANVAPLSTATSLALGKAGTGASLFTKVALAAAVTGAVSTTAVVAVRSARAPVETHLPSVKAKRPTRETREWRAEPPVVAVAALFEPVVEELPAETARVVPSRAPQVQRASRGTIDPVTEEKPAAAAPQASIAEELTLLRAAQIALRDGRIDETLAHTAELAARFPQGALREERAAVDMLGRCAQGSASPEALASFLASAAESPLKARVREACRAKP